MIRKPLVRRPLGIALAVIALAATSGLALAQSKSVRIGTSSTGSVFYTLAVGLTKMLDKHASLPATAEAVGGSHANMFAIDANKVDLAVANSGAVFAAYHGVQPFKKPVELGLVAQGQQSYRQVVVRVGSGIKTPADLKGKTVIGRRPALPELGQISAALLKVYNLSPNEVNIVSTTNTGEAIKAIKGNAVDAAVLPGSKGAGYLRRLSHDKKIRFLEIPKDKIAEMQKYLPKSLSPAVLPAKSYAGQPNPINVFALTTYLVADSRIPADTVYKVAKTLFGNLKEFHTFHGAAKRWTLENTLDDAKVPYHPGAIRYFKERKLWTAKLGAQQNRLMRK